LTPFINLKTLVEFLKRSAESDQPRKLGLPRILETLVEFLKKSRDFSAKISDFCPFPLKFKVLLAKKCILFGQKCSVTLQANHQKVHFLKKYKNALFALFGQKVHTKVQKCATLFKIKSAEKDQRTVPAKSRTPLPRGISAPFLK